MKVKIEDNLYLESDGLEFTIREYSGKKDKKGNESCRIHGHYSSVKMAIKSLIKLKVTQTTAATLKELVEDIQRIEDYIHSKITI